MERIYIKIFFPKTIINFKEDVFMNELRHGEYYSCNRLRLLQYLLENGFEPESECPDPTNYRYKWWLFKNSEELENKIEDYFSKYKKDA